MTTDYISLHAAALKSIADTIAEIKTAFDPPPPKIDTAQLPALYILTGGTDGEDESDAGYIKSTRTYRVQVPIIPIGQGNPYTREKLARPILSAVKQTFQKYPSLGGAKGVQSMRVMKDSGIVILPEYGMKFIGFEIPIQVEMISNREYAEGE